MDALFRIAEKENIEIIYRRLGRNESASAEGQFGQYIAMDYCLLNEGADERAHLAHELGHCLFGGFYHTYSPFDVRERHELKAWEWAYRRLIDVDRLRAEIAAGRCELWELADFFDVPEYFMRGAAEYYNQTGEVPFCCGGGAG